MRNRLVVAGLALPVAVCTLAACASSGTVQGQGAQGPGSSGSTSGATTGSTSSAPTSASASTSANPSVSLAAQLAKGLSSATSAHLDLQISAAGQTISGAGDEKLSDGRLTALNLSESIGSGLKLGLIIVDGRTYVKLPSELNHSGKPWQLVSARSADPTIRSLASSLSSTQTSASLSSVTAFVSAARTVTQTGTQTVDGMQVTSYDVDVDPSKLPDSYAGKRQLVAAGLTSLPVQITLDSEGRPLKVTENIAVEGQKVNVRVNIGNYNKSLTITAPPKNQTSTK